MATKRPNEDVVDELLSQQQDGKRPRGSDEALGDDWAQTVLPAFEIDSELQSAADAYQNSDGFAVLEDPNMAALDPWDEASMEGSLGAAARTLSAEAVFPDEPGSAAAAVLAAQEAVIATAADGDGDAALELVHELSLSSLEDLELPRLVAQLSSESADPEEPEFEQTEFEDTEGDLDLEGGPMLEEEGLEGEFPAGELGMLANQEGQLEFVGEEENVEFHSPDLLMSFPDPGYVEGELGAISGQDSRGLEQPEDQVQGIGLEEADADQELVYEDASEMYLEEGMPVEGFQQAAYPCGELEATADQENLDLASMEAVDVPLAGFEETGLEEPVYEDLPLEEGVFEEESMAFEGLPDVGYAPGELEAAISEEGVQLENPEDAGLGSAFEDTDGEDEFAEDDEFGSGPYGVFGPPPTCSPPPSPPSPPANSGQSESAPCLIQEGSHRGDLLKFFTSGASFEAAYEVGRKIGEGGFGKVFMARHRTLGYRRAVKRLNKLRGKKENHENELSALLTLDHPHVVKLVEYYDEERYLYLVFELCEGPDLFDRVTNEPNGRMNEVDASMAMRHVLKSLQCCHSRYRGHFDVKPENFMYTSKSLADLKMIDLGMSSGYDVRRRRNKIKGTTAYMAPEIWRGTYGPEADLWSVGIVLFIMLTGEPVLPETSLVPAFMKSEGKVMEIVRRRIAYAANKVGLSEVAQAMLTELLQHDRHSRPTVREALKHGFCNLSYDSESRMPHRIRDTTFDEANALLRNMSESFRGLMEEPMLKRVARLAMAHLAEPSPVQRLAFRILDWHGYGELSLSVLRKDFEARKEEVPADLESIFDTVDLLREGYISYLSFLAATLPPEVRNNDALCQVTFSIFDQNQDGVIDKSDLTHVFGNPEVCSGILQEVSFESSLPLRSFLHLMQQDVSMSEHPYCWYR